MDIIYLQEDITVSLSRFNSFLKFFKTQVSNKTLVCFTVTKAIEKNHLKEIEKLYKNVFILKAEEITDLKKIPAQKLKSNINQKIRSSSSEITFVPFSSDNKKNNLSQNSESDSWQLTVSLTSALQCSLSLWSYNKKILTTNSNQDKKIKEAVPIPTITHRELMEFSQYNNILPISKLSPLFKKKTPIFFKTYQGNTCTKVIPDTPVSRIKAIKREELITTLSVIEDIVFLQVENLDFNDSAQTLTNISSILQKANTPLFLIVQSTSQNYTYFAIKKKSTEKIKKIITEKKLEKKITFHYDLGIVTAIGKNMHHVNGIAGKIFNALGKNGINIVAISQGPVEVSISAVVHNNDLSKANQLLHDYFFLSPKHTLHLFIVGVGLVGKTLLQQIKKQAQNLLKNHQLDIKLVGIANSKKMFFDQEGIHENYWNKKITEKKITKNEEPMDLDAFCKKMFSLNLPNSIFVDNTANSKVANGYEKILKNNISIVTPNKIASSSSYKQYEKIHRIVQQKGATFLYETNVGAGLPVISTLQNLIHSGDVILKIEGILSGSLSYIFNTYGEDKTFKDVVLSAKEKGYTEPDPRDDLSGKDVSRKLLILAREIGLSCEMKDIKINPLLPPKCLKAKSVDDFFLELEKNEAFFRKKLQDAMKANKKLAFIASLNNKKLTVGLEMLPTSHPFYSLEGSDNIIAFTTSRYKTNPLVVRGPGAGAEVTASGVFSDIITIGNSSFNL